MDINKLFDLSGKVALITGASSGIGSAIAEAMGMQGASIIIVSNDESGCKKVTGELLTKHITAYYILCDVGETAALEMLYEEAMIKSGRIDILVNCAGISIPGALASLQPEIFRKTFSVNVESALYLSKLIIPQMAKRNDGVVILLASIAGVRGNKDIGLYGISKAGLIQLARNLAVEWGPNNIRVNAISPGLIETPFSKAMMENEAIMKRRLSLTPLRRVGKPGEIAGVAVMLASKAGGFITGQNIIVDGGTVISDGN